MKERVRDDGEHELIDTEDYGGNLGASNRRLVEDTFQSKVTQITNERARSFTKSKGKTPEKPLERNDGYSHHA